MRDPARQPSDGLHLLRLPKLLFSFSALGFVNQKTVNFRQLTVFAEGSNRILGNIQWAPILAAEFLFAIFQTGPLLQLRQELLSALGTGVKRGKIRMLGLFLG